MAEPLTREERDRLRAFCADPRAQVAGKNLVATIKRLLDERDALEEALDGLTATVEDASAELADDFQRPRDLACELGAAVRRARAKSEGR